MKTAPISIKSFVSVWALLVGLHFTILGISKFTSGGFVTPLILLLAVVQMIMVMLVFMEARQGSKLVKVFAAAGFFWLLIQFSLTASDYLTRAFH